ncbi:MAG: tRNA pseudouridine(38-40) synthase TruA [Melioribacteraceae bacterium]|nr:tRNA pseudouridine(38-40) synthase TruA [Melioribacteraceae bacterium]
MKNYRLKIEYNGTAYSGWQIQPNVPTIQGEITKVLKQITGSEINLIGSGRTDTGVHALGQVANFQIENELNIRKVKHSLNSLLSNNIAISEMIEVEDNFHSRFDAKMRCYLYVFTKRKSPFYNEYSYQYSPIFDMEIEKLNAISYNLLGEHNFTSFSKKHTDTENMVCNISFAKWRRMKNSIIFRIDGNRFLHGMVRTIVGTVLEIAEKNYPINRITEIANAKNREVAGRGVPAKGLFLLDVKY